MIYRHCVHVISAALLAAAMLAQALGNDGRPALPDEMPTWEALEDAWRSAVAQRDWQAGRRAYHSALKSAAQNIDDIEHLLLVTETLYYRYRVCRFFPAINETIIDPQTRNRFIDWLLANQTLTNKLLLTIDDRDDAPKAFAVLYDLVSFDERAVLEFPSLAVAYAVTHDRATYSPDRVRADFRYFTSRAADLSVNPGELPTQFARFLADSRTTVDEKVWVFGRRFQFNRPTVAYEAIRMRMMPRVLGDTVTMRPSLDHIHLLGGSVDDRTYFTVETARALGIPAARMRLNASTGEEFSWVGYLDISRQGWEWREIAGPQNEYVAGLPSVADIPSGSGYLARSELQRMARLAGLDPLSPEGRPIHMARKLVKLAEAVAEPTDPAELLPGVRGRDPDSARAAFRLILESIYRDPVSRRPWRALADVAARYPVESRNFLLELFLALESPARRLPELLRAPDARIDAFMHLASGVDERAPLEEMLARMIRATRSLPPEYRGRLELMVAEMLAKENPAAAYDRIRAFLQSSPQAGPVVLDMLDTLTNLGRGLGRVDPTVAAHVTVYNSLPRPRSGPYAAWTMRYQVGRKLEALYAELGRNREAVELQRSLNAMIQ